MNEVVLHFLQKTEDLNRLRSRIPKTAMRATQTGDDTDDDGYDESDDNNYDSSDGAGSGGGGAGAGKRRR